MDKVLAWIIAFILSILGTGNAPIVSNQTPTPSSTPLYFAMLGDTGAATPEQFAVAKLVQQKCEEVGACEAAFIAGDVIYEKGVKSVTDPQFQTKFEEPYQDLSFPFYIAYGNHDFGGCAACYIDYTSHSDKWRMPAAYYVQSFSELISFFVIDTEHFGREQQTWLKAILADSHARYKIVVGHRPIKTFETTKVGENWYGKKELQAIICNQADFYIAGHAHILEDNGDIGDCTVKQLVTGGGGAHVRTVAPNEGNFAVAKNGFVLLKVSDSEITYNFFTL